jgi:hypothetical protein
MNIFRDLERAIDEKLRGLFDAPKQRRELIEVQRAILDDVVDRAELLPRGRRVLPANEITVRIPAPEEGRNTAFRLVFIEGGALEKEIKAHLQRESVEFPGDLTVHVDLIAEDVPDFAGKGFHAVYGTRERATPPETSSETIRFTRASGETLDITKQRIHIGRTAEVLDDRRRLVRRNDVVLDEHTVSRAHAHIEYDSASGHFRLYDDGSSYGTSVLHNGRLVEVPKSGARGQKLESGDEIYIGQSRVLFETSSSPVG